MRTGYSFEESLATLVEDEGLSAIVATHDAAPIAIADQVIEIRDGRQLVDEVTNDPERKHPG